MKRQEFIKCLKLAKSKSFNPIGYFSIELAVFNGCALDDKRRYVTMEQVASLIFHNCATFGGTWLMDEIDQLEWLSKRWDLIN